MELLLIIAILLIFNRMNKIRVSKKKAIRGFHIGGHGKTGSIHRPPVFYFVNSKVALKYLHESILYNGNTLSHNMKCENRYDFIFWSKDTDTYINSHKGVVTIGGKEVIFHNLYEYLNFLKRARSTVYSAVIDVNLANNVDRYKQ